VLAIGVEKYTMKEYELHYAVKDAKDFGDALKTVARSLFSEIKVTPLYDTDGPSEASRPRSASLPTR
jgi:hypothetical protein